PQDALVERSLHHRRDRRYAKNPLRKSVEQSARHCSRDEKLANSPVLCRAIREQAPTFIEAKCVSTRTRRPRTRILPAPLAAADGCDILYAFCWMTRVSGPARTLRT